MKKIKNREENKQFLHCFLLFYTVFKSVKKIINFFTGFLSVAQPHLSLMICKSAVVDIGLDLREPISRLSGFPKCGRATDKCGAQTWGVKSINSGNNPTRIFFSF
jgi:hypothetical protein